MPVIKIQNKLSGDNKGSSRNSFSYLEKEQRFRDKTTRKDESFFNQNGNNFTAKEAIKKMDSNRRGLGKNDAKYYSLIISPSKKELGFLTDDDLKNYAKDVMNAYASNFEKGIKPEDLVWFAKLEHTRKYKGFKNGNAEKLPPGKKAGQFKPGDQRHVHILVRRKTELNMKLSPLTKARSTTSNLRGSNSKMGFDRTKFFHKCDEIMVEALKPKGLEPDENSYFASRYLRSARGGIGRATLKKIEVVVDYFKEAHAKALKEALAKAKAAAKALKEEKAKALKEALAKAKTAAKALKEKQAKAEAAAKALEEEKAIEKKKTVAMLKDALAKLEAVEKTPVVSVAEQQAKALKEQQEAQAAAAKALKEQQEVQAAAAKALLSVNDKFSYTQDEGDSPIYYKIEKVDYDKDLNDLVYVLNSGDSLSETELKKGINRGQVEINPTKLKIASNESNTDDLSNVTKWTDKAIIAAAIHFHENEDYKGKVNNISWNSGEKNALRVAFRTKTGVNITDEHLTKVHNHFKGKGTSQSVS